MEMAKTLLDFCTVHEQDFQTLFCLTTLNFKKTDNFIDFLFNEFKQTRLHFGSIETMFKTFAGIHKVDHENIEIGWKLISMHLGNFPIDDINYDILKVELSKVKINDKQICNIVNATTLLHDISKKSLSENVNAIKLQIERKMGLIGEVFSFLYSRDVQKTDCLFHKLIPDNPNSTRPGLDLLAVQFGESSEDDEVHFWESKCTVTNFDGQRYKIVKWFNDEQGHIYLSNVIESARIHWEKSYPEDKFKRANIALAKFQANLKNFKFIGSIVYDTITTPSDESIAKFDKIEVEKTNKNLVLFKTEELEEIVNQVYDKT